jgi:hypothetical protein
MQNIKEISIQKVKQPFTKKYQSKFGHIAIIVLFCSFYGTSTIAKYILELFD